LVCAFLAASAVCTSFVAASTSSFHTSATRKRIKQSLERTLCAPCSYCTGSGLVKSVNGHETYRRADVTISLHPRHHFSTN
jgi:Ribonuclease G/E